MMQQGTIQKAKAISLRFLIVAGIFLLSLLLFIVIANEMVLESENTLDFAVFQKLQPITNASMTRAMQFITFFGSNYFLLPAYIIVITYFLVYKKTRKLSLDIAATGITSTIILFSLKAVFHRPRPVDPLIKSVSGFSFPSGHSFSSFTFFGLLIYIVWNQKTTKAVKWANTLFLFFFACAIAFSRVYLHVHYASDVIAGFFLCLVWLSLSFWVIKKYGHKLP